MQNKLRSYKLYILLLTVLCCVSIVQAQDPISDPENGVISAEKEEIVLSRQDALRPSRAAFYSAVLPGLGQAYNKDYWKIPIVYGAIGTGVFFVVDNDNEFQRFRTALRNRIAGQPDEFTIIDEVTGAPTEVFDLDGLIDAQDFFRRRRDLAILVTAGIYLLQVLEANVDAHLSQFNIGDDLTLEPNVYIDDVQLGQINYGVKLSYKLGK